MARKRYKYEAYRTSVLWSDIASMEKLRKYFENRNRSATRAKIYDTKSERVIAIIKQHPITREITEWRKYDDRQKS